MASLPDLAAHFRAMETVLEALPEGVNAEIARGVYLMSPRPNIRHTSAQIHLGRLLIDHFGGFKGSALPDWLFVTEPEIRSETAFSRVIPDLAGWKKSGGGWPDPEENPVSLPPEWVAEILPKSTEGFDRGPKKEAYGLMGVGWLWLVDPKRRTIESFSNQRGRMIEGPVLEAGQAISAPPFEGLPDLVDQLFLL